VSLPDDYVHPEVPRTMTVREMARFQSFPDSFEFRAKETTGSLRRRVEVPQYTQVGNAVPPKMALAVGLSVKAALVIAQKTHALKAG
jgi:DNA (cytosine-5)-methyltransferase 1